MTDDGEEHAHEEIEEEEEEHEGRKGTEEKEGEKSKPRTENEKKKRGRPENMPFEKKRLMAKRLQALPISNKTIVKDAISMVVSMAIEFENPDLKTVLDFLVEKFPKENRVGHLLSDFSCPIYFFKIKLK